MSSDFIANEGDKEDLSVCPLQKHLPCSLSCRCNCNSFFRAACEMEELDVGLDIITITSNPIYLNGTCHAVSLSIWSNRIEISDGSRVGR